jgi:hypothetical protein
VNSIKGRGGEGKGFTKRSLELFNNTTPQEVPLELLNAIGNTNRAGEKET